MQKQEDDQTEDEREVELQLQNVLRMGVEASPQDIMNLRDKLQKLCRKGLDLTTPAGREALIDREERLRSLFSLAEARLRMFRCLIRRSTMQKYA